MREEVAPESRGSLLTVNEVAGMLRLRAKTVYRWAAARKIPCVRVGRGVRFARGDLQQWIAARKEGQCRED